MKVYVISDPGEYSDFETELFTTLEAAKKWADALTLELAKNLGEPKPSTFWTSSKKGEPECWTGWEKSDAPEHNPTINWIIHHQEVLS